VEELSAIVNALVGPAEADALAGANLDAINAFMLKAGTELAAILIGQADPSQGSSIQP
jgi:hypothetical protein